MADELLRRYDLRRPIYHFLSNVGVSVSVSNYYKFQLIP